MLKKSLLITLLLALFTPFAMHAQQALPYEYGFENNDLDAAGWALTASNTSTGIMGSNVHTGSYGFTFDYSTVYSTDAYLMSPILTGGTNGVKVSFYAKARNATYLDHYQVGYTTDESVTDPSRFTYQDAVTVTASWAEYTAELPARTVRVAIKYDTDNYNDGWDLYLDDFSFTAMSSCAAPTDLTVNYREGDDAATISWRSEARNFNIDVNGTVTPTTDNPYTLRGIEPATTYNIKVQAVCDEEPSEWASTSFFSGCPETFAIPYAYGFEDAGQIDCWTVVASDDYTGVHDNDFSQELVGYDASRTGNGYFMFWYTETPPNYLISPELSGIQRGLHVEFYYRQYEQGEETFHVGYSTRSNDPTSEDFIWGEEMNATANYQRFSANYPAETKYVAIKFTSDYQYFLILDDFLFEESASCLEPTGVEVADVTTTGATISWNAGGEERAWDIYVTDDYEDVPDENTTPTYANVDNNTSYPIGNLDPATTYYVYVRALCDEASAWSSPATFNTECEAMALPYSEDFADGMSVCWNTINGNTSYNNIGISALSESLNVLSFYRGYSTGDLIAVLPEVDDAYPLSGYQISFYACYANTSSTSMTSGALSIGIMTDPNDASTFEEVEALTITDGYSNFGYYQVRLNTYTGSGNYLAIKNTHTSAGYVLVAYIEVTALPACLEPTDLAVAGGKNAVVTWEGDAESFDVAYMTSYDDETVIEDYIIESTTDNEFDLSDYTNAGDNYVFVRANCGETDGYSEWVGAYFDVNYCTPNPTNHDGSGITGVSFGTGDYVVTNGDGSASLPASAPYYGDYTSMIGAVQAGVESTIAITTGTGNWPYTFVIWVDLDNSLSFEDREILYIGKATDGNGTLNATITVPATQELGDYRMRIYGADSYFTGFYNGGNTNWDAAHDPCSSGTYRHAHDYTLRVLEAPSCLAAGDVTVAPENITSTSAVISWTNNNGTDATYTVMQGETVLTTTAVDSYLLEGLTAATTYPAGTFTIISDCDETMIANVPAFTTECADITTLPWSEDFEGFANNTVPLCWDNSASTSFDAGTTQDYYIWGVYNYGNNNMIRMENYWAKGGTALINTPTIVLPAEGTYMLSFDYAHNASCGAFKVNVSEDNGATWIELGSYTKGSGSSHTDPGTFTPATISLADYAGESIILQFFANANYGDGAIFVDNIIIEQVYTKFIEGYHDDTNLGGYYLLSCPVNGMDPADANMVAATEEDYDLFRFNQSGSEGEWENYKYHNDFVLEACRGYLYASKEDVTLTFKGSLYNSDGSVALAYDANAEFPGWNLVGNPYLAGASISKPYYKLAEGGAALSTTLEEAPVSEMEGVFVQAEEDGETVQFAVDGAKGNRNQIASVNMIVSDNNGQFLDNAIVRFDGGSTLNKFQLKAGQTKLYFAQDDKDCAIVASEAEGEIALNFRAETMGTYTLSFNVSNVNLSYMHIYDKLTGNDVNVLTSNEYTFVGSPQDTESRFVVRFSQNVEGDDFAYQCGDDIIVNGNGTVQVFDVMGRFVTSFEVNGNKHISASQFSNAVYIFRMNGETVKTQKIVVR